MNAVNVVRDTQTSNELSNTLKECLKGNVPTWYGVTDIVNPARKYFEIKNPEIPDPPELIQKFRHGNATQELAFQWFKAFKEAVSREVEVTGDHIGISGLKGRLDFLFSNHIVEFKTTTHGIFSVEDVLKKNPQDLEQLVTYALLTGKTNEEHFLVYNSGDFENSFRAFTVNVKDDKFGQEIRKRLDALRSAVLHDNPHDLGRCRYFEFGCKFNEGGYCNCSDLEPIDNSVLSESVSITRNTSLETELNKRETEMSGVESRHFSIWDLLTPRKAYLRELSLLEEPDEAMDPEVRDVMRKTGNALFNSPLYVERRELESKGTPIGNTTILSITTSSTGEKESFTRLYPSTIRIFNNDPDELSSDSISSFHLLRLAMICSLSGSNAGYLIFGFKNDEERVDSFRVTFKGLGDLKANIEKRVEELNSSISSKDPTRLPECPRFLIESCGKSCLCKMY